VYADLYVPLWIITPQWADIKVAVAGGGLSYLQVPMNDTIGMTMIDRLQDLLDAVRGVGLRVELPGHNVLKELATGHSATQRGQVKGRRLIVYGNANATQYMYYEITSSYCCVCKV